MLACASNAERGVSAGRPPYLPSPGFFSSGGNCGVHLVTSTPATVTRNDASKASRRLQLAAAVRDCELIDAITDELAACYPGLVRPRKEIGMFRPGADARARWEGTPQ